MGKRMMMLTFAFVFVFAAQLTAATYTVTNTNDSGAGSLRDAIILANSILGTNDLIDFNIPGPGVHTIMPLTPLPALTDTAGVTIDGFTQPGAGPGANPPSSATLLIEIKGLQAGASHGLRVQSMYNVISGLVINEFEQCGICIDGGIANIHACWNTIFCNYVGTDPSGMIGMGNGRNQNMLWAGIHISNEPEGHACENTVEMNIADDNYAEGIWVEGPKQPGDVGWNHIYGNYCGLNRAGTGGLGNAHEGICLSEGAHHNDIDGNYCCNNGYDGIGASGYNNIPYPPAPPIQTHNNLITDNMVGIDVNGNPLGNVMHGIVIGIYGPSYWGCADFNTIGPGNIIANNGLDGVSDGISMWEDPVNIFNTDHNLITQNSIYNNAGLGIDLEDNGITFNDPNDPDFLSNEELNFPVITNVSHSAGTTTITGTLDIDTTPTLATIEVFKARIDPSGYGEGDVYLGFATPDAAGNWTYIDGTLSPGDTVTATTTDMNNNTSEFCANAVVPSGLICIICTPTILTKRVPDIGGIIIFDLKVNNCGATATNVYGEMYPTIGDCASPNVFDFNLNKLLVSNLAPGDSFTGNYFYPVGNVSNLNLGICALNFDVGPAINNWVGNCCDDFRFYSQWGRTGSGSTDVMWGTEWLDRPEDMGIVPSATILGYNYPNPFNASTTIPFDLSVPGNVNLKVYNLAGQLIETLIDGSLEAGHHTVTWDASSYSSGVYFYKLQVGDYITTRKMNLLK